MVKGNSGQSPTKWVLVAFAKGAANNDESFAGKLRTAELLTSMESITADGISKNRK